MVGESEFGPEPQQTQASVGVPLLGSPTVAALTRSLEEGSENPVSALGLLSSAQCIDLDQLANQYILWRRTAEEVIGLDELPGVLVDDFQEYGIDPDPVPRAVPIDVSSLLDLEKWIALDRNYLRRTIQDAVRSLPQFRNFSHVQLSSAMANNSVAVSLTEAVGQRLPLLSGGGISPSVPVLNVEVHTKNPGYLIGYARAAFPGSEVAFGGYPSTPVSSTIACGSYLFGPQGRLEKRVHHIPPNTRIRLSSV